MAERLRLYCLAALIVFLPLSAWLVSFSGQPLLGLIRDGLLAVFIGLSLLHWKNRRPVSGASILALAFLVLTLVSFFYRDDSITQWLRGVRYLVEPLLLFAVLQVFPLRVSPKMLWRTLAFSTAIVVLGAAVELFAPGALRLTYDESSRGYLGSLHLADSLSRLQSTLAGPNALGLFLLLALLLFPVWSRYVSRHLAAAVGAFGLLGLFLTLSRSSYAGFLSGLVALAAAARNLSGKIFRQSVVALLVLLLLLGALLIVRPQELWRPISNTMRFEQYQRVWEQKSEIGWWGRGAGAAGLSSVDRLDGGPNFYTENTYLDAYESLGILGALTYIGFWVALIRMLLKTRTLGAAAAASAAVGLVVAGVFINHYTGQAAIWLTLLFAGVAVEREAKEQLRQVLAQSNQTS